MVSEYFILVFLLDFETNSDFEFLLVLFHSLEEGRECTEIEAFQASLTWFSSVILAIVSRAACNSALA